MIQRAGQVVIHMLENVQQVTIKPLIQSTIAPVYLGFFEFVHNAKKHGKALLSSRLELIIN